MKQTPLIHETIVLVIHGNFIVLLELVDVVGVVQVSTFVGVEALVTVIVCICVRVVAEVRVTDVLMVLTDIFVMVSNNVSVCRSVMTLVISDLIV